jgi:hypothetical protein
VDDVEKRLFGALKILDSQRRQSNGSTKGEHFEGRRGQWRNHNSAILSTEKIAFGDTDQFIYPGTPSFIK